MIATGRTRHLDHTVTDLADLLLTAHQYPNAVMPWMLVASSIIDEETARKLANLISHSPNAPVAFAYPLKNSDRCSRTRCAWTVPRPTRRRSPTESPRSNCSA